MFPSDVDIPMWLIITFSVAYVMWPLLVLSAGTAIVALIAAVAAKSVLALKVAAVAGAVFFLPVVIGVVGAPVLKLIEQISYGVSGSESVLSFSEWKENTPLIRAVKKQSEKKIEKLLKKGADVNAADAYGKTALHYFAEISLATDLDDVVSAIRLFASYNPDLTLRDENGNTPLDTFLRYCHDDDRERYPEAYAEIIELLTPAAPSETPKRESPKTSETAAAPLRVATAEDAPHIERDDMRDDW